MKKLSLCILVLLLLGGTAFVFSGAKAQRTAETPTTLSAAAFSLRNSECKDATGFLVGSFRGEDGSSLSFGENGELKLSRSWNDTQEGKYQLTQSASGAAIITLSTAGGTAHYVFALLSDAGQFRLTDADGNSVTYQPVN